MYYIFFDDVAGTILGLSVEEKLDVENNWFTVSDEAYNFILDNNGKYLINTKSVEHKIAEYKEIVNKYKNNEIDELNYIVIEKSDLCLPEKNLKEVIFNRLGKNNSYCRMFIENGIDYILENGEKKHYSYKEEDQINFNEIKNLISEGILTDETGIPLKASGEIEYDYVSVKEFNEIYDKLVKNKFYQLFYLGQYNEYVKNLKSINDVHRLQYEMILPDKSSVKVKSQMELFNKL